MTNHLDKALKDVLNQDYYNDICDIVEDIMSRIDDIDNATEEDIVNCLNDSLIYYDDMWTVARWYCNSPIDLDFNKAIDELVCTCEQVLEKWQMYRSQERKYLNDCRNQRL